MTDTSNVTSSNQSYPKVDYGVAQDAGVRFPEIEQRVLAGWDEDDTFRASVAQRDDAPEFVFYDGPPFANGLPHYGHLLTGYVKDLVPRFQTMRGKKVERRFGWDTHGLPAELEAEKQLGIKTGDIGEMGIARFNDYCRQSVLRYTEEWRDYVTRQARWVDFDNDYKTLDLDFMESVMWAFKQLWDKGLVYQGFRVLPYSWYEQTPLSNQESKLDDAYKMRQDPAVTVDMPLHGEGPLDGANAIIWTTTPWTLPSNLAVAVHPDIDYVQVAAADGKRYVLAKDRLGHYARELGESPEVLSEHKGADLVGLRYDPPFDFFVGHENAHRVISADYVTTESGTGIVHLAPAFGEEDMEYCAANGIEIVLPLDAGGKFTAMVPPYEGLQVFDANPVIIKDLKAAGKLLRHETIEHSYPHSWRSGQPLIYMAVPSWFVAVTEFRDRMVELNKDITWVPEHIRDGQFGKWLEGARDWNISRNRYWGSPIPVWVSDDPAYPRTDVYGSLDELERDFGVRPTDLHRPVIDDLVRPNPDDPTGRSMMRRVPEVLDCWFESGSMPFAQVHYPFENQDWFETHFPGDFIVEYNGQTRGWFYNLHVLATALFDRPAFKTVAAHGIVLGDDGLKMSKSKGNYPDVNEVFDRDGSDAMRWFLMSSPILRGGNLVVTEQGIRDGVRQAILPLWNAWSFLQLYAPTPGEWRTDSTNVLDRYILAKLAGTRDVITEALETTDIAGACDELRAFCDALTNWYVRRSRSRFWDEDKDAVDTLHTVLEVVTRLAAPLLPLISEVIWRGLTGGRSVHLADWPAGAESAERAGVAAGELPADAELVSAMDEVRSVCSTVLGLRKAQNLRVRLPLPEVTVASEDAERLRPYLGLIADEVNVKKVDLTTDVDAHGRFELVVNARAAGPRLGKDVQTVIKAVKAGDWSENAEGVVVAAGIELLPEEYTQRLVAAEPESTAALPEGAGLVVLDSAVTEELEAEGWAKDRIRELQDARRAAGLEVSDRITVVLDVPAERRDWALAHRELIAGEILAVELELADAPGDAVELGEGVRAAIAKA
ncbi:MULTISPECIES: isoleucine--tRNA ligase [unclassified Rhodococcus (in: high G+C Gram-positive bacteria)]|uniref:isoleucine--tRNA ligase n=1 Tax=unclassified Rhodococcus (in: high G+C Gram-positive bacteria) TaxID=192944 RepID=UPI00163AEC77|nr:MULTISPECIES: isoleucine--tRNA ligase [unclassified Rhodococcus (in: high G+C Gram-positive bacteria)]MBC2638536.1 isoleucine--tRNA ligase [Rhodococcus sp. 3A]MBC2896723.1 isoleucine--tRNA ligase [Rhodococcus sp. 4CII]